MSPQWLELLRHKGGGPAYSKLSRSVCTDREVLDAYMEARTRVNTIQEKDDEKL